MTVCVECQQSFEPVNGNQRYCSIKCQRKHNSRRNADRLREWRKQRKEITPPPVSIFKMDTPPRGVFIYGTPDGVYREIDHNLGF